MINRGCLVICVWILQVSSAQNFLIRTPPKPQHSPIVGKPPPLYLHGPLGPYYMPPPAALRAAAPPHLAMDPLNVPAMLPVGGHHKHPHIAVASHGHHLTVPQQAHIPEGHHLKVPQSGLSEEHHMKIPHSGIPHHPKVPQFVITPPASPLRAAVPPFHSNQSPLAHLPNLHPHHPLASKQSPIVGHPRHVHVHHHVHHGRDFFDHDSHHHHHVPTHHHHFHSKPHGVVIKKKTIIKKFRNAQHPHRRFRRELSLDNEFNDGEFIREIRTLPAVLAAKLASDPKSKVDLMGTLNNVNDATKNICESIQSPVYHIRDAIGSARDVVFSIMKMTPTGILIPSSYGIMELKPGSEVVGAINPNIAKYDPLYAGKAMETETEVKTNEVTDANTGDTLTAVQFMLRNGFRKGTDSIQHAGDAIHSTRRAILTVPQSVIKLLYPFYKSVELGRESDRYKPAGLLGARALVVPEPTPRLVGAGRLLELLKAAAVDENKPDKVAAPFKLSVPVKMSLSEGREKYQNFINKLRNDVKERMQSLN